MIKINYDDLEFPKEGEDDFTAYYKNQLFTGIAFENHKENYFEYKYQNGRENGRSYGYNTLTKEIIQDENYVDGVKHGKCYNKDLHLGFEANEVYDFGVLTKQLYFNFKGVLIKKYDKALQVDLEFYDDGSLFRERKKIQNNGSTEIHEFYYLGKRENWMAGKLGFEKNKNQYYFEFNSELIFNHIHDLNSFFHWYPVRWFISELIENDKEKAFEFLRLLINHKDEYFIGEAAYFLGELGDYRGLKYLKKVVKNTNKPWIKRRFKIGGHGNSLTNGKKALISIDKIRKENSFPKK